MAEGYSLKKYFGGKGTEAYRKYKEGQKAGKWADLPDYIAQGGGSGGYGGGVGGDYDAFYAKQKAEEDAALKAYEGIIAGQPSPEALFTRYSQEFNLPALRETAFEAGEKIRKIPGEVATHMRNFGASSSQIARRAEALTQKALPSYEEAMRAATAAGEQVGEKLQLGWQGLEKQLRPYTERFGFLKDRFGRMASSYDTAKKNALDFSIAKLQGDQAISLEELKQAGELALAEKNAALKISQYDYERLNPKKLAGVGESGW